MKRRCKSTIQVSEPEQAKKGQGKQTVIGDGLRAETDQVSDYMKGNWGEISHC